MKYQHISKYNQKSTYKFTKGIKWIPWLAHPMKDAQGVRYAWRSCQDALYSKISEWGNPIWQIHIIYNEGNLENWNISCTKGKEINWDSHSSDERTGNSLNHICVRMRPLHIWCCKNILPRSHKRTNVYPHKKNNLGRLARESESLVFEYKDIDLRMFLK